MRPSARNSSFVCRRCLRATALSRRLGLAQTALYSSSREARTSDDVSKTDQGQSENENHSSKGKQSPTQNGTSAPSETGAMTRRLEEAVEDALVHGGTAGRRAVEDSIFSEELKEKLLDKIADAKFRKQYSGAFAQTGLDAAGEGTRNIASARAWKGEEETADAVLRMLDDAKKPLAPGLRGKYQPPPVDTRLKKTPVQSPGQRVSSARDRASTYAGMSMKNTEGLSDTEKEEMKKQFRERFQPAGRTAPLTISGITALANERIEDAISRGQFKDLPRGKKMKRDPRADNPFIDTTEYIMNKMIQRQEIVPPWIEKQQELAKAVQTFRARLRNDWKRHSARMIASQGGPLQEQIRKAEAFAAAEEAVNPRQRVPDDVAAPTTLTDDAVMTGSPANGEPAVTGTSTGEEVENEPMPAVSGPFRDAAWERAENAYMALSVDNLNALARSYNLMAPQLAKKPYFSLERELAACYADVAPLVAGEIRDRAVGGSRRNAAAGARTGAVGDGLMDRLGGRDAVRIHVEAEEKAYGLKEWWRDFWKKE